MNCHRDKTLDSYLGQMVRIKFKWDNDEAIGKLEWVDKITPQTPYKPQMYHCGSWSFYKSHVKSVEVLDSKDKGVLEQLAEKQNNLSATNKAWSDAIEKNGYVN